MQRSLLVSHFHWDREWYRNFQAFRARLIDAIDAVLDVLPDDPGYRFVLDGQTILLEDYLAIRPHRRAELADGVRTGRLAIGPWYVQPDSFLPSGEAHVRNLLEGRRVASSFGGCSKVAYVPDSFGHPAQFPQLLRGFGLGLFVYWRGNGSEIDDLGPEWTWVAPDGSEIAARHLQDAYFGASSLPHDAAEAADRIADVVAKQFDAGVSTALLMNGFDHAFPDLHTGAVASALDHRGWDVRRGVLDDLLDDLPDGTDAGGPVGSPRPRFSGELAGGRTANLLPGVWSARLPLKLRNRRCESVLERLAEPLAALSLVAGGPDETPAVREAWRALLANQAHDSIGGCSIDEVHEQMGARYDAAEGLAQETAQRLLCRIVGRPVHRAVPWQVAQDVAVFNPSPHPRTDLVRMPLDGEPAMTMSLGMPAFHPLMLEAMGSPGFTVDGRAARVVPSGDPTRPAWLPDQRPFDVEFVAKDVPAFGWRQVRLEPADHVPDVVDDGREIEADAGGDQVRVACEDAGTLSVSFGNDTFRGLVSVEDEGDRGDSYDFDPVDRDAAPVVTDMQCTRHRHENGLASLDVVRTILLPAGLTADRDGRLEDRVEARLNVTARVTPGVGRVDLTVTLDNIAEDHRFRLAFPTGSPAESATAATTFDVVRRSTTPRPDEGWLHPAPATFAQQGWVDANGLTVVAPGLPEAQVRPDGTILVTLLRSVGWLARFDLRSRPIPAGPMMPVAGAQCKGAVTAHFALLAGPDPSGAADAETALAAGIAGPSPLVRAGHDMLSLSPPGLVLTAVKPADGGEGLVVRLLNPADEPVQGVLRLGFACKPARPVRLDETDGPDTVPGLESAAQGPGTVVGFRAEPHRLVSLLLEPE